MERRAPKLVPDIGIRPAIERALASGKPAVVNVITDQFARSSTFSGFFGEAGEYS